MGKLAYNRHTKEAFLKPKPMELKYQKTDSGWGLTAFFEGYRLIFTGLFERKGLGRARLKKLFPFLRSGRKKKKNSIIKDLDLFSLFSTSARHAWNHANVSARKRKSLVGAEDVFLALLKEASVQNLLHRLKVSTHEAESFLNNYLTLAPSSSVETVKKIPFEAFNLAVKLGNHKIGSLMLLGALLNTMPEENILQAIFANIGLTEEKLELFAVWLLKLNYEFPKNSPSGKLLYCLRQSEALEEHFGYFFELPAIEAAVYLSQGQTFKDIEHKKALQLLVKAGLLGQTQKNKIISENLVAQAAMA